jgi:hypothetical protein
VGSVPYPRMDESEALPGCNVEGLRVVRGSIEHSVMLSLGAVNDSEGAHAVLFGSSSHVDDLMPRKGNEPRLADPCRGSPYSCRITVAGTPATTVAGGTS